MITAQDSGLADKEDVPDVMHVRMSLPSRTFTYLPKVDSKVISVASKVVSIDEAVAFHASAALPEHENTDIQPIEPEEPDVPDIQPDEPAPNYNAVHSSGGGCNSGYGTLPLIVLVIPVFILSRKNQKLFLCLMIIIALSYSQACAQSEPAAADYALPIPYEIYTPAGSYDLNFNFTQDIADTVSHITGLSPDRVHQFSDIISGTWNVTPPDF